MNQRRRSILVFAVAYVLLYAPVARGGQKNCDPSASLVKAGRTLGLKRNVVQSIIFKAFGITRILENQTPLLLRNAGETSQGVKFLVHPLASGKNAQKLLGEMEKIDQSYFDLGLRLPEKTHVLITAPTVFPSLSGPYAIALPQFSFRHGVADASITLDAALWLRKGIVDSPFILAHERAHLVLAETFRERSFLRDGNPMMEEAVADFLAYHSTGITGFQSRNNLLPIGRNLQDRRNIKLTSSEEVSLQTSGLGSIKTTHRDSLLFSHLFKRVYDSLPEERRSGFVTQLIYHLDGYSRCRTTSVFESELAADSVLADLAYVFAVVERTTKGMPYESSARRVLEEVKKEYGITGDGAMENVMERFGRRVSNERHPQYGFLKSISEKDEESGPDALELYGMGVLVRGVKVFLIYQLVDWALDSDDSESSDSTGGQNEPLIAPVGLLPVDSTPSGE